MKNSNSQTVNQVASLLKYTFGLVPIVAGLDKFTNLLTQWDSYVSPSLENLLPFSVVTFMMIVGVIEIIAGILVLLKAEIGGLIVSAWLVAIAIVLITAGKFDVAVRDLVMAIAAYSMVQLNKLKA